VNVFDPNRDQKAPIDPEDLRSGLISVREVDGAWTIECRGRKFGSYPTQESAVWDAVVTAIQAREAGKTARVDLHEGTAVRTIWPKSAATPS
jgi:hypothetical protein